MIQRVRIRLLFTIAILVATTHARAQELSAGTVKAPSPTEKGAVALFTLQNSGMYVAYLMSATSEVAGKIEFHNAAKGPQPLEFIAIEPGDVLRMDPKGTFVYLTDLKRPLTDGETITLTFKNEGEIPIEAIAVVKAN